MYRFLLSAIIFFFIIACQQSTKTIPGKTEMEFSVDTSLVDRLLYDTVTALWFRLPGDWLDMTADTATRHSFEKNEFASVRLICFAKDKNENAYISLLDIQKIPDSNFTRLKINYNQLLNPNNRWERVLMTEFYKDSFPVQQYVMSNAAQTHFRLIFYKEQLPLVQLDYQLTNSAGSPKFTRILESIIGSLKTSRNLVP